MLQLGWWSYHLLPITSLKISPGLFHVSDVRHWLRYSAQLYLWDIPTKFSDYIRSTGRQFIPNFNFPFLSIPLIHYCMLPQFNYMLDWGGAMSSPTAIDGAVTVLAGHFVYRFPSLSIWQPNVDKRKFIQYANKLPVPLFIDLRVGRTLESLLASRLILAKLTVSEIIETHERVWRFICYISSLTRVFLNTSLSAVSNTRFGSMSGKLYFSSWGTKSARFLRGRGSGSEIHPWISRWRKADYGDRQTAEIRYNTVENRHGPTKTTGLISYWQAWSKHPHDICFNRFCRWHLYVQSENLCPILTWMS